MAGFQPCSRRDYTDVLRVEHLCKEYSPHGSEPGKRALDDVSIYIPRGSFFALLGCNGAGKSTLINILAGLTRKTSGRLTACGYDLDNERRAIASVMGIVPQEPRLDPFFPVYEALEHTAGYYGVPKNKRRTNEIIAALGLEDKVHTPARKLSGGARRRLLIAKALVHEPEFLVLDEPTAGVDIDLRKRLWDYIKNLNKEGTSILLTTHYLEEAEQLCDRMAIIDKSQIIAQGSKEYFLSILDGRRVTITWNVPVLVPPNVPEQCIATSINDHCIEISYSISKTSVGEILLCFSDYQQHLKDLRTHEPCIEDVFHYLTTSPR